MKKCPCRFLVPLAYNDGTAIDASFFLKMKIALDRQFGGLRVIQGVHEGWWEGQVEGVMEIEVAVAKRDVPALRQVVVEIGRELGQEAMYFHCPEPSVEIINVETGRSEDDIEASGEESDDVGEDNEQSEDDEVEQ